MEIQVGPYTYSILYEEPHDRGSVGETDCDQQIIRVSPLLPKDRARVTLWHEVLHGLMDLINCPLTHEQEEDLVDRLAPAVVLLLDRNPVLRG